MPAYRENNQADRLAREAWEYQKVANIKKETIARMDYTDDEMDKRQSLEGLITSEVASSRDQFITGELNPNNDADWNKYIKELNKLGVDAWLKQAQSVYDRQMKK